MVARFGKNKKTVSGGGVFIAIILSAVFVLIIIFLFVTNIKLKARRDNLSATISDLEKEIKTAEQKNQELKLGVQKADSADQLEKVAREQFGLKKPGEEVVTINKENGLIQNTPQPQKRSGFIIGSIWDWVKSKFR